MFSRTTMASSINKPIHNDSAINVMKLSVKPNACNAMNVAMTEIGSVSPVMIVERHECRNRNTIRIVRTAPSRIVAFTRSSEPLIQSAFDHNVSIFTSSGHARTQLFDRLIDALADFDDVRLLNLEDVDRDRALCR